MKEKDILKKINNFIIENPNDSDLGYKIREEFRESSTIDAVEDDKYLRLLAEFTNYKNRTQREKEQLMNDVTSNILSSILDIDSDISIAIKNDSNNKGLKLIMSKLENFLNSKNIKSVQTEKYDPDVHEVVSMVGESDKIIDVVSKGYELSGKIFRYPKVIIG